MTIPAVLLRSELVGIPRFELARPRKASRRFVLTQGPAAVDRSLAECRELGRAPAVGYRIQAGRAVIFYAPDLVSIDEERAALADLDLYVGDGAAVTRSIVRYREGKPIGHASIRVQLDWCAEAGVPWAVFTHCGSEIVTGDARTIARRVASLGQERGVRAEIARDGLELRL